MKKEKEKTSFGFKKILKSEKANLIKDIFTSVSTKYDLMNDVMSLGIHRLWKDRLIEKINPSEELKLLDVAGGTGDIAFKFLKKGGAHVTVCDLTESMIKEGKNRSYNNGYFKEIDWVVGDALNLPFKDNEFDVYTISFGLRNVSDIKKSLSEAKRVLKKGGRFFCLEFSNVEKPFAPAYDFYSFNILPKIGKIITKDEDSYKYLVESIRKFPKRKELQKMMEEAGFEECSYQKLSKGIVSIHSGYKF